MQANHLVVGLIVARGGGSTLYRKNAYVIHGKPVLQWAIEIMQRAGFISTVFVWTEDAELAQITRDAGAVALERPRDMVHHYSGNCHLGEWYRLQTEQIQEHLGRNYDFIVPFNCNCICFQPESLRTMYATLRDGGPNALRIQAVGRLPGGLCLENPLNGRLYPFWTDTEKKLDANPPLYRMIGVTIVNRHVPNSGNVITLHHEVSPREGFDFQNVDDIPYAQYYLQKQTKTAPGRACL
jgi:hypothetical protein